MSYDAQTELIGRFEASRATTFGALNPKSLMLYTLTYTSHLEASREPFYSGRGKEDIYVASHYAKERVDQKLLPSQAKRFRGLSASRV